ncbi:MAG: HRDC domain-containing protein [Deltaproteobacteria bacterium]|nr:HRDC domain-containing protein [Deltaproteobacteria bacterium]
MTELRILTLHLDPTTGLFDDRPLRGYLRDREVIRAKAQFFTHAGQPTWSVFLETRPLTGGRPSVDAAPASSAGEPRAAADRSRDPQSPEREAFNRLLAEMDETERARYQRLTAWRRDAARREGVPHYVIATNAQLLDLTRRNPATLAEG